MPRSIPAFGFSAVPLPTKIRTMRAIGPEDRVLGGSLLVVAPAELALRTVAPDCRRVKANVVQSNGSDPGATPCLPVCSQDDRAADSPVTASLEAVGEVNAGAAGVGSPLSSVGAAVSADKTGRGLTSAAAGGVCDVAEGCKCGADGWDDGGKEVFSTFEDTTDSSGSVALGSGLFRGRAVGSGLRVCSGRSVRRGRGPGFPGGVEEAEAEVADPEAPAEPAVSANAAGIDTTVAPIPSAKARAPNRPM